MKKAFFILVIFFGCIFSAKASLAATYYVDSSRPDDSGAGTSWTTAEKTIAAGVAHLASGDTLKIKGGANSSSYITYNEAISIASKSFSSVVTIMTDDGSGNPGYVQLTGSGSIGGLTAVIGTWNTNNITIDGRVRGGFYANKTGVSHVVIMGSGSDCSSNLKALNIKANGSASGEGIINLARANNAEIGYCDVTGTSPFLVQMFSGGEGDPAPCSGGSIHHCTIQGTTNPGYSAIDVLRFDDCNVYSNYLYNVNASGDGPTLMRVRQGNDNRFYNNVISHTGSSKSFLQARGMSTGTGAANRNWFFNNTIINSGTAVEGVAFISDNSSGNKWFNNLVIGNISSAFMETWAPVEGGSSNNEFYNNVVTGSIGGWLSSGLAGSFSVSSGGTISQGTSFITLAGAKPYPYYSLAASKDGVAVTSLTTDYNGNSRSNPPDVGAFEYGGTIPPPVNTAPAAPTGVKVI